ncbi:MAG: isoleucine--tRNA ligase [Clostridiales bacterium]|nr:isoleucine--tRNA ligase [Candidatus Apopatousia equi]
MQKENGNTDFIKLEEDILKFWKDNSCFEKLVEKNKNGERFRFLDGPVTANNKLGVHHIWGRTLKDIAIKYNAMIGKSQQFQNGFDAQGMWVEVETEKDLGLSGKPEILKYGIDNFTNKCMDRVKYFANEITNQSIRMGQWMDWDHSYFTNTDENITSIWAFLKKCDENGYIVRRNRPISWCPRCGTSLSEHEMAGSYHEVVHTALFIKLPVKDKDFKMVAWTTTPWTLSANVALAVNPELDYVKVKAKGSDEILVMGKDSVERVLKKDYEILETFKGSELVGLTYETCFPELVEQNFVHKIVPWEDVDNTEGSCVVHIAPGCGSEDFDLGLRHNLPQICPINEQGVLLDNTGFLAGKKTVDVVELVVNRLKQDNKLVYAHNYKHSYPYCWRCKEDLVYKLISTWYIDMSSIRPKLLKAIDEVEFQPEYAKKRMVDWLNNMGDWNISRSRFYGLPLPFYVCEKCGKVHVIGSLDELRQKAVNPSEIDKLPHLHRPWIDNIKIKCDCGEELSRITEVGDCWLDAGITPFSTKKYFTDKEYFENNFPSEYVCEMIEQIKLWFYSLLVMSVVLTGKAPYKKVVTYQYVKDENGEEFHKSGGNSLKCDEVANKVGADAIRYLYAGANPTNDMRFGYTLIDEARRKMLGLWNAYSFFNTYASIDNPKLDGFKPKASELSNTDKWLLAATNKFVEDSKANYSKYQSYNVVKDFEVLIDNLTNFYIRANRRRFWKGENDTDKLVAYYCLYNSLKSIVKVMAPIIPFMTEYIWQKMVRDLEPSEEISVIVSGYPQKIDCDNFDEYIEYADITQKVMTLGNHLRAENNLKVKQPLSKMYIVSDNENTLSAINEYKELIKDEINVKEVEVTNNVEMFSDYYLGLNFKTAGAVLKGDVQKVKQILENASSEEKKALSMAYDTNTIEIAPFGKLDNSLFIKNSKPKQEFVLSKENDLTVVLDIELTEELISEGILREIIRNAQVLRKQADFNIDARIMLNIKTENEKLAKILSDNKEKIMQETLAVSFNEETFIPDIKQEVELDEGKLVYELKTK